MTPSADAIKQFIETLIQYIHPECRTDINEEEKPNGRMIVASIASPQGGRFLIGKNGQNLQALECLVRAFCARKAQDVIGVTVDINDYRRLKAQQALDAARHTVARVRSSQKAEALAPMNAYERRIVHMELANFAGIKTESEGEGEARRVVIKPAE